MLFAGRIETTNKQSNRYSKTFLKSVGFDMGEKSTRPTQPTKYYIYFAVFLCGFRVFVPVPFFFVTPSKSFNSV